VAPHHRAGSERSDAEAGVDGVSAVACWLAGATRVSNAVTQVTAVHRGERFIHSLFGNEFLQPKALQPF